MYKPNGRRELGGTQSRPGKRCRVIRQICDTRPGRWAGLFISLSKERRALDWNMMIHSAYLLSTDMPGLSKDPGNQE